MKITLNYNDGIINLPAAAKHKLKDASRADLAALLLIASKVPFGSGAGITDEELSAAGISPAELDAAISFWRGADVMSAEGQTEARQAEKQTASASMGDGKLLPDTTTRLSASEAADVMKNHPERLELINACQQTMGRIFNMSESSLILSLRECLGVGDDYILMLIAYAKAHDKKAVKYVERMAYGLYERDITTSDELEEYLQRLAAAEDAETKYKRMVGADGRSLSKKEKEAVGRWVNDYGADFELIEAAYERTVTATGKLSLPYMDKIMSSWHEKGIKTAAEAENESAHRKGADAVSAAGSFDTDDFFEMAVKRGLG
ncbi:MAG: DnaD domain protein [Firmicutes bacterium]|nr:DnaD domain protein [Bacillota bacterium]